MLAKNVLNIVGIKEAFATAKRKRINKPPDVNYQLFKISEGVCNEL